MLRDDFGVLKDWIHERRYIKKQERAYSIIREYVDCFPDFNLNGMCSDVSNEDIVWQFWNSDSGIGENQKRLLNCCFKSVSRYSLNFKQKILDINTLRDYINLPEIVYAKLKFSRYKGFSYAAFSDLVRAMLLYKYGGIWMDATIYLLNYLPEDILKSEQGFAFARSNSVDKVTQIKFRHYDSCYFSWSEKTKIKLLSSFLVAGKNRAIFKALSEILINIWINEEVYPHYFTFHMIYEDLIERKKFLPLTSKSDIGPHLLQFYKNSPFSNDFFVEMIENYPIQKLNWKENEVVRGSNLEWLLKEGGRDGF